MRSYFSAASIAASSAARSFAFATPTDEPVPAGLTKTGIGETCLDGVQRVLTAAREALARDKLPRRLPDACGVGDQLCDGLIHTGGGGRDVRTDIGNARDLEQALNRAVLAVFAVHHGEDHVDALTHNAVVFKA